MRRLIKKELEEYELDDALTAVLKQSKARLRIMDKLHRKRVRDTIREKSPGYAEWRDHADEIDEILEEFERRRLERKYSRFRLW